jgi:hypothetical protein
MTLGSFSYLLITQSHGPNKALILYESSRKVWSKERRLGDHSLPAILRRHLSSLHHLEHLLSHNPPDLGQRYAELRSFFGSSKSKSAIAFTERLQRTS